MESLQATKRCDDIEPVAKGFEYLFLIIEKLLPQLPDDFVIRNVVGWHGACDGRISLPLLFLLKFHFVSDDRIVIYPRVFILGQFEITICRGNPQTRKQTQFKIKLFWNRFLGFNIQVEHCHGHIIYATCPEEFFSFWWNELFGILR